MLDVLGADRPCTELAEKLELFGRLVGTWDFEVTKYLEDGSRQTARGEWLFGWVLGGRAVQDVWIVPDRAELEDNGAELLGYGTTIRFFDTEIDAWRVTWIGVLTNKVYTFIARPQGDEIVMEGRNEDDLPMRWIFSDIGAQSFRWRNMLSADDGTSWSLKQEMVLQRRSE
jgi:hypothetical protein